MVDSAASDREAYLRDPDLGRRLGEGAPDLSKDNLDLVLVIADGLSATAVNRGSAALVTAVIARLPDWRIGPVVLARQGRVAIGDPIGEALGAQAVAVIIGERPGLSVAHSQSAYVTWAPRSGRRDAERNCVSNIHAPDGLSVEQGADKIVWLLREARRLGFTGVALKDRQQPTTGLNRAGWLGEIEATVG